MPAASICLEEKAGTTVAGSIGTMLTSVLASPADSSAKVKIMSPEVPSGTPMVLPLRSARLVIPGWAITRSAFPKVLMATTFALPDAGSHIAPGPM
jgi:hypothetical protein